MNALEKSKINYLVEFLQQYRGVTYDTYKLALVPFYEYVTSNNFSDIEFISEHNLWDKMLDKYFEHRNFKNKFTYANNKRIINTYLKWLYRNEVLKVEYTYKKSYKPSDGDAIMNKEREIDNLSKLLTDDDMKKLINYSYHTNERNYIAVYLMCNYGLRRGDIVNLKRQNFKIVNGKHYIILIGKSEKRLGTSRHINISRDIYEIVEDYMNKNNFVLDNDYLFTSMSFTKVGGNKINKPTFHPVLPTTFNHIFNEITMAALGRRIRPHDIRRSRATNLSEKDMLSPYDVAKYMGWSSINQLGTYDKRNIHEQLREHDLPLNK